MSSLTKRFIYYIIGSVLLSFGISLAIRSEFGAGAFDAMYYNFSELMGISIGQAMYASIILVYIVTMILKPRLIYILGLLLTGLVTYGVESWLSIIPEIEYQIIVRTLLFAGALFFLPLGITFIIKSRMPLSPMDNIMVILIEKTKKPVWMIKTAIELSFASIALLYGFSAGIGLGQLSIGTVVITLAIGPIIDLFMRLIKDIEDQSVNTA